ncbi:hypothetical protein SprV_0200625800 [Sparganum proliferum]
MKPTASPPPKRNAKHANHNCAQSSTPTHNRFQCVLDDNGHSGHEVDLLDTYGSTAPLGQHRPSSLRSPLPRRFRRQPTLTALLNHHFHPPPLSPPPPPPLLPPTPEVRTRTTPALTATASSPHTSAWSVTCESIAQRLAYQCLEHQPTPTALASTAHIALALSRTAWAYSATYASTRVELTALPTHPPRQTAHSLHRPVRPPQSPQLTPAPPTSPATLPMHIHLSHRSVRSLANPSRRGGQPVPGAPTYTHRTRLNCPHCTRTFTHRMGLFGHMRIHEHLR